MTAVPLKHPVGVPPGAHYLPAAETFEALAAVNANRVNKRAYLRVAFPFSIWYLTGVMLTWVEPRVLSVRKRTWRTGRCLIFNDSELVPGVWVWTVDDSR